MPPEPITIFPLGWTRPYSSVTAYAPETMGEVPALTLPETVTTTELPFGGHRVFGVAVHVVLGGVCSTPLILVIVTPPVPPGSTKGAGGGKEVAGMPPVVWLYVSIQVHSYKGGEAR